MSEDFGDIFQPASRKELAKRAEEAVKYIRKLSQRYGYISRKEVHEIRDDLRRQGYITGGDIQKHKNLRDAFKQLAAYPKGVVDNIDELDVGQGIITINKK